MRNSNNDIEELEELLTELEGQEAQIVTPYSEEDDAVTRQMEAPLGDQDWMVQVTALDRRMMSTSQVLNELSLGKINQRTLVWRGGMDDWMPLSRVDELSRASAPPMSAMPRAAYQNLAPPPPPPARASAPMWSSPQSAPLPPPPVAIAPSLGLPPPPVGMSPSLGMPSSVGLPPPPAPSMNGYNTPKSVPVSAPIPSSTNSQGITTRPVAVDFSDVSVENDAPMQSKRWVMALSAVAILAVFVTVYSLSSGGGDSDAKEAAAAQPQAVNALQPSSATPKEKAPASPAPAAAAKAEPAPVATATAKPSDEEDSASDERSGASASARQTAPARYSPRSEWRRRSRSGGNAEESSRAESGSAEESAPAREPAPRAAAAASTTTAARAEDEEAPSSESVAAVAEEVDEAPKSTGKSSSNTFNREAAKTALDEAAEQAKNCRPQGGPSGTGRVQIRYEPSGKVANVAILTSKFDNTTAGSCVRMLFRRAKVPEFTGAPVVVVNKSFEIP
jgi:hypothetical protein